MEFDMKILIPVFASFLVSASASAATVIFTDSFGLATTNWTHLLGTSTFNSALGTLNSATFTFADDVFGTMKAENTGASSSTISASVGGTFEFRKSGSTLLTTNLTSPSQSFSATAFDGVIDYGGSSGFNFGTVLVSGTGVITLTGAALTGLSGFGTLGSVGYDVFATGATGFSSSSGNGNLSTQSAIQARYNLTTIYDYTPITSPVPEPGVVAMFAAGLATVTLLKRRSQKAK